MRIASVVDPMAGTMSEDTLILNYVDLDATGAIGDFECTSVSYDGHQGHDIVLRTFGEQLVGVPIFAIPHSGRVQKPSQAAWTIRTAGRESDVAKLPHR